MTSVRIAAARSTAGKTSWSTPRGCRRAESPRRLRLQPAPPPSGLHLTPCARAALGLGACRAQGGVQRGDGVAGVDGEALEVGHRVAAPGEAARDRARIAE